MNRPPNDHYVEPRDAFLEGLVADLVPVRASRPASFALATWTTFSVAIVTGGILMTGPLRSTALSDLGSLPMALETLLGLLAAMALAWVGLEIDVPAAPKATPRLMAALALMACWVGLVLGGPTLDAWVGFASPTPSMEGKRLHCFIEALLISAPPALLALAILHRRTISPGLRGGVLLGVAGACLTATAMQLACLHAPSHALHYHLTPPLLVGLATGLAARFALPRD